MTYGNNRIMNLKDYKYTGKNFGMEILDFSFLLNGFSLIKILGYIDPGSATAIIAMIIGAIAGVGMTLKLYWYKIKHKITRN